MSSRADFIPRQYVDVFTTLQDNAPPWDKDRIEAIINDSLQSCQQVNMNDVFESIGEVLGRWVVICTIMRRTPKIGVCILLFICASLATINILIFVVL